MTNQLQILDNQEFGRIRTIELDGKVWFCGKDIATALGYKQPSKAVIDHCTPEGISKMEIPSNGGNQLTNFINEGNVYRLIINSKLPNAKQFEKWLFEEVLPSIRKNGYYGVPTNLLQQLLTNPDTGIQIFQKIKDQQLLIEEKEELIKELKPKADFCDDILTSGDLMPVKAIASMYGMTAQKLNKLLFELHVQYKVLDTWILYAEHINKGYTKTIPELHNGHLITHMYWTATGLRFLYETLADKGIKPKRED